MPSGRGLFIVTAVLIATALMMTPLTDGATGFDTVTNSGVTMAFPDDDIKMNTVESYSLQLHLTNGNATPVTVMVDDAGGSDIYLTTDTSEIGLYPSETKVLNATVRTDRHTPMGEYTLNIIFSVSGSGDPVEVVKNVPVTVVSNYSSGENYNKIIGVFVNDLPAPFNGLTVTVIITVVIWLMIAVLCATAVVLMVKAMLRFSRRDSRNFGGYTAVCVFFCVVLIGVDNMLRVAGAEESIVDEVDLVSGMIYVALISLIAWDVYKTLVSSTLSKMEERNIGGMDTSLVPLLNLCGKLVITVMGITLIMSLWGLDLTAIVASAGLTSLGLSFGVKPAINELFSGLIVLTTRPFNVGDTVSVNGSETMEVSEIGILRTRFDSGYKMEYATMPNSKIVSSRIVNYTHGTRKYRTSLSIKVPFGSNVTMMKKMMRRIASQHPNVLTDGSVPKPAAIFTSCSEGSAIVMTLAFYVSDYGDGASTCGQIRESILKEFAEKGIKVPHKKTEINLYKGGADDAE